MKSQKTFKGVGRVAQTIAIGIVGICAAPFISLYIIGRSVRRAYATYKREKASKSIGSHDG